MMGYNTLLNSHYDKYFIDYSDFKPRTDPKDFKLPEGVLTTLILFLYCHIYVYYFLTL